MADPNLLTGIVGTAAGVIGAGYGILAGRRQKLRDDEEDAGERAAGTVASWAGLNAALDREVQRLHAEMDRLRGEYERQARDDRQRISELENEVRILRRTLRGDAGDP